MPLPDAALSLQVSANAVQSRPKRAMIVRMSTETLDALEAFPNHPPLAFDFGDAPGIHIGDAFFPMRAQKESSPHELYLRAASIAKPMAPLKLYAHVVGKFMVERQLGDKVTDKVRQQTMVAKQQHSERQAILLDQPPIPAHTTKHAKRKTPGSGTVVKKTPIVASRKVSPLPQNTPSTKANADVRRRLVHCLAISPRLSEEAVKMVGGPNISDATRDDLLALLDQVAERAPARRGDKSPRPWMLKPPTWTEVRPYEWPKLTEHERLAMARQARMAFTALKIPESDPAWENVRYRSTAPAVPAPPPMTATTSNRSSTSAQAESKRSAVTTKEAKLKSKQDVPRSRTEIQMKDESTKPNVSRVNAIKRAEAERPASPSDSSSGAKSIASRRLPGSGYQAKKSPQSSTVVAERSGTPVDPRTAPKPSPTTSLPPKSSAVTAAGVRKTVQTVPTKPAKREDESDRERDREHERHKEREREKREREKGKQREEREREREKTRHKQRDATEPEKRQKVKDREREEVDQERRQRIAKERAVDDLVPTLKRKTATRDMDGTLDDAPPKTSVPKRRKLDDGTSVVASSSKARDVSLSGPKKPVRESSPAPRLKMKKEPSPSGPNQERRLTLTSTAGGSTHKSERPSKVGGSTKPRRRSPIYTSSEDEGEIPQPRKRNPSPPPVSDRSISSDQPTIERAPRQKRTPRAAYPPPTDHVALRALYQSQYTNYLGAFSKIVAQKRKIEAMLNGDSEAEVDVMDPDDLIKLSMEHKSLKTELENIHDIFTKGTTAAVASGSGGGGFTSD